MVNLSNGYGSKLSKDNAAKNIIDGIINDAKLNKALDEFNEELNDVTINTLFFAANVRLLQLNKLQNKR